jgi:hypothetical protein
MLYERGKVPTKSKIVSAESEIVLVKSGIVSVEFGMVPQSPEVFRSSRKLIMSELILII